MIWNPRRRSAASLGFPLFAGLAFAAFSVAPAGQVASHEPDKQVTFPKDIAPILPSPAHRSCDVSLTTEGSRPPRISR